MAKKAASLALALVVAAAAGAAAFALPRAAHPDPTSLKDAAPGNSVPPHAALLVQPDVTDVMPDEAGGVTLLSRSQGAGGGAYLLRTVTVASFQPEAARVGTAPAGTPGAAPSSVEAGSRPIHADTAWVVAPDTAIAWDPANPARLSVTRLNGRTDTLRVTARPAILTAMPAAGGKADIAALAVLPGPGDRVMRLSGDLQFAELAKLPEGVVTAVAGEGGGAVAFAWAEPARPPTAGLTVLGADGRPSWQAQLSAPAHRLAFLDADTLVVAVGQELVAIRKGEILWRRTLPAAAVGVAAAPGGSVLVALPLRLLSLNRSGVTAWEMTPNRPIQGLHLSPAGTRAALIESGQAEIVTLRKG